MACRLSSQMVNILTHRYGLLNTSQVSNREFIEKMVDVLASHLIKKPLSNRVYYTPRDRYKELTQIRSESCIGLTGSSNK